MAVERPLPRQACFLIGPPDAPEDMKVLYDQAEQALKQGDDRLAKKLFEMRQSLIAYATKADPSKKPMLQQVLEEKFGKPMRSVDAKVEPAMVRGGLIPNLVLSLETTLYADGTPIAGDLSPEIVKGLANVFGYMFKARWVQPSVK